MRFVRASESADRCKSALRVRCSIVEGKKRSGPGSPLWKTEKDGEPSASARIRTRQRLFSFSFYLGLPLNALVTSLSIRASHPYSIFSSYSAGKTRNCTLFPSGSAGICLTRSHSLSLSLSLFLFAWNRFLISGRFVRDRRRSFSSTQFAVVLFFFFFEKKFIFT